MRHDDVTRKTPYPPTTRFEKRGRFSGRLYQKSVALAASGNRPENTSTRTRFACGSLGLLGHIPPASRGSRRSQVKR
jgi:hypothetical protein